MIVIYSKSVVHFVDYLNSKN